MQNTANNPIVAIGRSITRICASMIFSCAVTGYFSAVVSAADSKVDLPILVEAEGFADTGGWVIDPQFMDLMGSPYLLAHGLGVPVKDAKTEVTIPKAGSYQVWVRTKDWVAQWKAPGTPGRFQITINGTPLKTTSLGSVPAVTQSMLDDSIDSICLRAWQDHDVFSIRVRYTTLWLVVTAGRPCLRPMTTTWFF